jgi:hypothetical protein
VRDKWLIWHRQQKFGERAKIYILREPKPVEPQKSSRSPRPKPAAPVAAKAPACSSAWTHNDSIAVSLAPSEATEVRRYGILGGEHDDVLKLAHKLQAAHPGMVLKFCYEAGPRGFALCRCLRSHGWDAKGPDMRQECRACQRRWTHHGADNAAIDLPGGAAHRRFVPARRRFFAWFLIARR